MTILYREELQASISQETDVLESHNRWNFIQKTHFPEGAITLPVNSFSIVIDEFATSVDKCFLKGQDTFENQPPDKPPDSPIKLRKDLQFKDNNKESEVYSKINYDIEKCALILNETY